MYYLTSKTIITYCQMEKLIVQRVLTSASCTMRPNNYFPLTLPLKYLLVINQMHFRLFVCHFCCIILLRQMHNWAKGFIKLFYKILNIFGHTGGGRKKLNLKTTKDSTTWYMSHKEMG